MNSHGAKSRGQRVRFCAVRSALRNPRLSPGFAYIALLVAIIIIGISLGAAGKYWSNVMLREKEEELLFRGEQYRQAIERYADPVPGRPPLFPSSIDDLLKDSRTAVGKRHLRQKYKDPITGEDFEVMKQPGTLRIMGVHSSSDKLSLKQAGFPVTMFITGQPGIPATVQATSPTGESSQTNDTEIESTTTATIKYSDWLFIASSPTNTRFRR